MPDRDALKLQRKLNRLQDKADSLVSKGIGISLAIKILIRKDKQLTREWGKTIAEIDKIRKELGNE